jgi:hypothetical protein
VVNQRVTHYPIAITRKKATTKKNKNKKQNKTKKSQQIWTEMSDTPLVLIVI